jgi:hypothetical protein
VKSCLLQLQNRCRDSRRKHDALDKMLGQLGGQRLVRFLIRVPARIDESRLYFPDRIEAGEEGDTARLQRGDCVAAFSENARGILAVRKIGRRGAGRDQRVGPESDVGKCRKLIVCPRRGPSSASIRSPTAIANGRQPHSGPRQASAPRRNAKPCRSRRRRR